MDNVLLVNPSIDYQKDKEYFKSLSVDSKIPRQQTPRLGIAYMMSVARLNDYNIKYIDMVVENISYLEMNRIIKEYKPDVIAFTAYTTQIKTVGLLASKLKEKNKDIKIMVGGPHASAMPNETKLEFPDIDIIWDGEGEYYFNKSTDYDNIDNLPFPSWDMFNLNNYPGSDPHQTKLELPISTSRGCPFSCVFCARQFGKKRRYRTIDSVIQEMWYDVNKFGATSIYFCDETFVVDINFSKKLFQRIINEGLHKRVRWSCELRVDIIDNELFKLMKESGCYYVFFGFESGNDEILERCGKNFTVNDIKSSTEDAKNNGIICTGSFILGLPGETKDTIYESIELAKEIDVYSVTFPIAVPFPGTEVREMALNNEYGLRILSNDWDLYGKQYPGVMDSDVLCIDMLRYLQNVAYKENPKRDIPL